MFDKKLLRKQTKKDLLWLDAVPERVLPGTERPEGTVYHFLLPDRGMAAYNDKVIKKLAPDEIAHMKAWNRSNRSRPGTRWALANGCRR